MSISTKKLVSSRWLIPALILIVGLLGLATASAATTSIFNQDDSDPPLAEPSPNVPSTDSTACDPVMKGLSSRTATSPLSEVGIVSDQVPKAVGGYGIANVVCLSDELAGRVEAIYAMVGVRGSDGAILVLAESTPVGFADAYFDTANPDRISTIKSGSGVFIATTSRAFDAEMRSANSAAAVSLWSIVTGAR